MCKDCDQKIERLTSYYNQHISSLADAFAVGSSNEWESSEPLTMGGPAGIYSLRAPFTGDCQFKVDVCANGNADSIITISTTRKQSNPLLTSADPGTGDNGAIDGIVLLIPAKAPAPVASEWYNVRNSENTVYANISNTTAAAYVTIQFRQKRGSK